MIISSEPGAFSLETLSVGVAFLHPDLAVPVPDVSARSCDGLEGDGSCAPEAGVDDPEHLWLRHEVTLYTLVNSPVVAGPVLGGDTNYHFACN